MRGLGRYELLEQLGSGGMGAVYRARDARTGKEVALKQLSSSLGGDKRRKFELLFEREYHTLVRLKHPRIIEVYDYGLTELGPYYTMELLDGTDLHQLAPLPYGDACRLLRDVASSLALIHAQRLVHRDVSPRNVRLTRDGRAKLIDFGALSRVRHRERSRRHAAVHGAGAAAAAAARSSAPTCIRSARSATGC